LKHIKGHQEKNGKKLSHPAELNVEADRLATLSLETNKVDNIQLKKSKARIILHVKQVTSKYTMTIKNAFRSIQLRKYLQDSNNWDDNTIETVWWDVHGPTMKHYPIGNQSTLLKFIHNRSPCNKRENLYYGYIKPFCRNCKDIIETPEHILQCKKCAKRQQAKEDYLKNMRRKMEDMWTDPATIRAIIHYVTSWINNTLNEKIKELIPEASITLKLAIEEQTKIGWDHFIKGRITRTWSSLLLKIQE
jgi:hypothetical protein